MTISAKSILASQNPDGLRVDTLVLRYPLYIHAQGKTHRLIEIDEAVIALMNDVSFMDEKEFSRNAQSSRACGVQRMVNEILNDTVIPSYWGSKTKSMQAGEECDNHLTIPHETITTNENKKVIGKEFVGAWEEDVDRETAWLMARNSAIRFALAFDRAGYHQEIVNRLLIPFIHITTIVTATEWDNFFNLRIDSDAQHEIQTLALAIKEAKDNAEVKNLEWGEWHLPFANEVEIVTPVNQHLPSLLAISTACGARVSFNNLDGTKRTLEKDRGLHDRLLETRHEKFHASPFEHPCKASKGKFANFNGFQSYRNHLETNTPIQ